MSTQTLKEKLIKSVKNVNDDKLLESLLSIIELESDNDLEFEFDEEQLSKIETAKQEIRDGKTQTSEEVNKEIDKWLNK